MVYLLILFVLLNRMSSSLLQIDKQCSIQAVTDHSETDHIRNLPELFMETYIQLTNVWTIYSANHLIIHNLDQYSENDSNIAKAFSKSTGNFGLTCCIIVLLKLTTLNSTFAVIENSIHQNSENAIFVNIILPSFQFDTEERDDHILNFPLIFYSIPTNTISVICPLSRVESPLNYTSIQQFPPYKLHNLYSTCFTKNHPTIPAMWISSQLDRNKMRGIIQNPNCMTGVRKLFYSNIKTCFGGYLVAMLLSVQTLNISITTNWLENPTPLTIKWLPVLSLEYPQIELRYKPRFRIVSASKTIVMYCSVIEDLIIQNWNQSFSILEGTIWALLFCIVGIYTFLYKNVFQAFDLLWHLVGKRFMYKHRPSLVIGFLIGMLMLSLVLSATFNTKFLNFRFPISLVELAKIGHKIYLVNGRDRNQILQFMSPELQDAFATAFAVNKFTDLLSLEEGIGEFNNFSHYISTVRSSKIIGIGTNVYSSSATLTSINTSYTTNTFVVILKFHNKCIMG